MMRSWVALLVVGCGGVEAGPAPSGLVDVELEPLCHDGYSGPLAFFEDAKRPIATVALGHFVYSDVAECHADTPLKSIVTVALGTPEIATRGEQRIAAVIGGDPMRPLFDEECVYVVSCDDRNGDGACGPAEPRLNNYNDRSRYHHASASRRARMIVTPLSRSDAYCAPTNYYSRCCPDAFEHRVDEQLCYDLHSNSPAIREKCPATPAAPAKPAVPPAPPPTPIAPASTTTIHDPRSCEPDAAIPATATWRRVVIGDGLYPVSIAYTGGNVFVVAEDAKRACRMFKIDPATRKVQALASEHLADGAVRTGSVRPPEPRCIAGSLVFWGDSDHHRNWGTVYDPRRDAWRAIQPLGGPESSVSTTDGKRLYVVEAAEPGTMREISAAAYDPATDRWLAMAPGPALGLRWISEPRFVHGQLLVWGCHGNWTGDCAGGAYDPSTDRWRPIVPAPLTLAKDRDIQRLLPITIGETLHLLAAAPTGPARTFALGADLRWTEGPKLALTTIEFVVSDGRDHGLLRTPKSRSRLARDLALSPLPDLPDPAAEQVTQLATAGQLFVLAFRRSTKGQPVELALWTLR